MWTCDDCGIKGEFGTSNANMCAVGSASCLESEMSRNDHAILRSACAARIASQWDLMMMILEIYYSFSETNRDNRRANILYLSV